MEIFLFTFSFYFFLFTFFARAGQAKNDEEADKNLATYGLTKSYISEQLLNAGFDMKSYTFDTYVKGPNQVIECGIPCASAPALCVCVCARAHAHHTLHFAVSFTLM